MDDSLGRQLWSIYDELRIDEKIGFLTGTEFQKYFVGFVSYKYLSENLELFFNNLLKEDSFCLGYSSDDALTFEEAYNHAEYRSILKETSVKELGYFLSPDLLFRKILFVNSYGTIILNQLKKAFKEISDSSIGTESQEDFENLFEAVDLDASQLGKTLVDKNKVVFNILNALTDVDFRLDSSDSKKYVHEDIGDAFEYLLNKFSLISTRPHDFYTPKDVSILIAKLLASEKSKVDSIYDPCCGSAALLLEVSNNVSCNIIRGQEIDISIYNTARLNMTLHGLHYRDFDIKQGDTLKQPHHLDYKFDAIVSHLSINSKWSSDKKFLDDVRFRNFKVIAPKNKGEYAFIQHMLFHLKDDGVIFVIAPHGLLFRSASEGYIRKHVLCKMNYVDAIIGLPANLFYSSNIPACILVFKKNRGVNDKVLFIDASKEFNKFKIRNQLRDKDIEKIVDTYKNRREIAKYSHNASLDEIRENDFNLNIPRYVDTFEEEELLDIDELVNKHKHISAEIEKVTQEIKKACDDLNIKNRLF